MLQRSVCAHGLVLAMGLAKDLIAFNSRHGPHGPAAILVPPCTIQVQSILGFASPLFFRAAEATFFRYEVSEIRCRFVIRETMNNCFFIFIHYVHTYTYYVHTLNDTVTKCIPEKKKRLNSNERKKE
jgi:hypothetical protein